MSEKERLQLENECLMKYSKAQMIQKYIDELEESSKLSELWCKSQEENQKLKKLLEEKNKPQIFIDTQDMEERYAEGLYQDYLEEENKKYKNQQKEFMNYMMNTIENITHDETDDEEIKGYLIQRGNTFKEILSKYKEIIEGK